MFAQYAGTRCQYLFEPFLKNCILAASTCNEQSDPKCLKPTLGNCVTLDQDLDVRTEAAGAAASAMLCEIPTV